MALTGTPVETGRGRPIAWRLITSHPHPASFVLTRPQPAAITSISTSQSLTSACATIAAVGTARPPGAAARVAALGSV